jgi:Integrase core domain
LTLTSAPAHPKTLGKLERLHRMLKEWLADEDAPVDLASLQALLDRFRAHYKRRASPPEGRQPDRRRQL